MARTPTDRPTQRRFYAFRHVWFLFAVLTVLLRILISGPTVDAFEIVTAILIVATIVQGAQDLFRSREESDGK